MVKELNETKEQIKSDITLLTETEDLKRKKRNKRILILNGALVAFNLVFIILNLIFVKGDHDSIFVLLISIFWILAITIHELDNSNLRWVSGMQQGLHELERKEFDKLLEALRPENVVAKAKKGTK